MKKIATIASYLLGVTFMVSGGTEGCQATGGFKGATVGIGYKPQQETKAKELPKTKGLNK